MKGIILAGGEGNRLKPLTNYLNKHFLPVYNHPIIHYPLLTLLNAGITEILLISGKNHAGAFLNYLGSGKDYNCHIYYEVQEEPLGIAHAISLAEHFVGNDNMTVILGDNIFEDNFSEDIKNFKKGANIFLKEVKDPNRFGVPEIKENKIINIEEKPTNPKSEYAVTGLYVYDNNVFNIIKTLKPSQRGEYEITDVNNAYIKNNQMGFSVLKKSWTDAGTFESLFEANKIMREVNK